MVRLDPAVEAAALERRVEPVPDGTGHAILGTTTAAHGILMSILDNIWRRRQKLAGSEEFPAVIDAVRDNLRTHGFNAEADRLHRVVHEMVCTTSNEFYHEARLALRQVRKGGALPRDVADEIRRLVKSIDHICRWR